MRINTRPAIIVIITINSFGGRKDKKGSTAGGDGGIGSAALRTRGDVAVGWSGLGEVACSDAVPRSGVAYAARCGTNRGNVGLYRRSAVRPDRVASTVAHPFQPTRQRRFIARLPTSAYYSTSRTRLNTN